MAGLASGAWTWYGSPVSRRIALILLFVAGCQRVTANQRGTLARPDMELGAASDLSSGEEHARGYREGATGGGAGKAGGCGCN